MPLARSRDGRVLCCACGMERTTEGAVTNDHQEPPSNGGSEPLTNPRARRRNDSNASSTETPQDPVLSNPSDGSGTARRDHLAAQVTNGERDSVSEPGGVHTPEAVDVAAQATPRSAQGAATSNTIVPVVSAASSSAMIVNRTNGAAVNLDDSRAARPLRQNAQTRVAPTSTARHARDEPHSTAQARERRRDDVSTAMGEKLLQGWTMLQDACETCGTPLLRNSSGTLLCVLCSSQRAGAASMNDGGQEHPEATIRNAGGPSAQFRSPGSRQRVPVGVLRNPSAEGALQVSERPSAHDRIATLPAHAFASIASEAGHEEGAGSLQVHPTGGQLAQAARSTSVGPPNAQGMYPSRLAPSHRRHPSLLPSQPPAPAPLLGPPHDSVQAGGQETAFPGLAASPSDDRHHSNTNALWELYETERAILEKLPVLRAKLAQARDVESMRVTCSAIREAADAITALRNAGAALQ